MMVATVWTIARREISTKLRDKAFIFTFVAILAMMGLSMSIPILTQSGTPSYTLGVVGDVAKQSGQAAAQLAQAQIDAGHSPFNAVGLAGSHITVVDAPAGAAEQAAALADGDMTAILTGDTFTQLTLTGKEQVPDQLANAVSAGATHVQATQIAAAAGLTPAQLAALTTPVTPQIQFTVGSSSQYMLSMFTSMIFAILFFFAAMTFGIAIAQSVVEEKQSRVVEILVAAIPTRTLLAGKILGNTILAVGQLLIFVSLGLVAAQVLGYGSMLGPLLASSAWFVVFFIAGFIMLACLWALAGSLASRVEDLGTSTTVMQFVVMVPFFAAIFVRDALWIKILSFFPFTAPLMMPARVLSEQAMWWEPIVALALVVATAGVLIVVGSKLYSASILHTSSRLKLGQAWKAARSDATVA